MPEKLKKIFFTVTNDLTYDQRMHRICHSLAAQGYAITLVGRKRKNSQPLTDKIFSQRRLRCFFNKGKLFYAEYNIRLFFFLLFKKMDAICAIDLDTILPCLYISKWKKIIRVYDAHELFTELKEVVTRPAIKKIWTRVERKAVPHFKNGYTVSESIAAEFKRRYQVEYETIRNIPVLKPLIPAKLTGKTLLYQGAVNEARGFEYLLPALQKVNSKLVICGDGNFMPALRQLIAHYKLEDKVELKGMVAPAELEIFSSQAYIGVAVAENQGLNQYLALPNKFFDYIHAGLPQLTMNYPEYKVLNAQYEVAVLIDEPNPEKIATALNNLLGDDVLYSRLKENCLKAREVLNWQAEEKKLLAFYKSLFTP
jgi:glycosyltransferase involved in cell wall biosynthesis